jgi:single-strand DNA-binding protein
MLRVSLLGNLGADPELRYSQRGTPMATFRVAVHQVRTGPDGERQESTEWFRVRAMGRLAERAQPLTKGARVLVVGQLTVSRFQSRDGEPRVGFDVWADEVVTMSGRAGAPEAEPTVESGADDLPVSEAAGADVQAERPPATNGAQASTKRPAPAVEELDALPF